MALPKHLRFPNRRLVRAAMTYGQRLPSPLGTLWLSRPPDGRGRVHFIVSTRVSKKSTVRHRLQRQLDGWAARRWAASPPPVSILVLVHPAAAASGRGELTRRAEAMGRVILRRVQP